MKTTKSNNGGSLKRVVRRLVAMLLGERNAINLYGEDDKTKQFEAYAKKVGATVIACDFASGYQRDLDGMIYPLTYTEEKHGEKEQNQIALGYGLGFNRNGGDDASTTNNREGVPPVVYLKPGERITHVLVMKSPNDPSSATRP